MVPILIACSIKDRVDKGIIYVLMDYAMGFFLPIQLHYKLVLAKFIRETIIKQNCQSENNKYLKIGCYETIGPEGIACFSTLRPNSLVRKPKISCL